MKVLQLTHALEALSYVTLETIIKDIEQGLCHLGTYDEDATLKDIRLLCVHELANRRETKL